MKNKTLQVSPAKKIYQPKYPSYFDKSPLLYPETRPYPFNLKFLNWILKGSLAGGLLLTGVQGHAQNDAETLSNPFPLSRANVPYFASSFGTGMPERLRSEKALQAIRNAFEKMDIKLDENTWIEQGVGAYVDGYNKERNIGYVLLDGRNMDRSFISGGGIFPSDGLKKPKKELTIIEQFHETQNEIRKIRNVTFEEFKVDKGKFISKTEKRSKTDATKEIVEDLKKINPEHESKAKFNENYLAFEIQLKENTIINSNSLVKKLYGLIDKQMEDSVKKLVLFNHLDLFSDKKNSNTEYFIALEEKIESLQESESRDEFIWHYLNIVSFQQFYRYSKVNNDPDYIALKIEIIESYPFNEWPLQIYKLKRYIDNLSISLSEAKKIDENNTLGRYFVAPISFRDNHLIVNSNASITTDRMKELLREQADLHTEMSNANGMTKDILERKRKEYYAIHDKYNWSKIYNLPKSQRDSLQDIRKLEMYKHSAIYKAMEKLTDEEKAIYQRKLVDVQVKIIEEQKEVDELYRQETMKKLEEEVINYIKWAQSQMGG